MRRFRFGAWGSLIAVGLWASACGDDSPGEAEAASGGSATGGSGAATGGRSSGGSPSPRGGADTGSSGAGAAGTDGSGGSAGAGGAAPNGEAGAGAQAEADAGANNAGAGGADDAAAAAGGSTGGALTSAGSGGNCEPLAPATGAVFDGDLFLTTPADVEAAQQYSEITGSLQVLATSEPLDVELPRLRRLGGDLRADSTMLRRILAPELERLAGRLWVYLNDELVELDLHNLAEVGEDVYIHRNLALRVLQLDALVVVSGVMVTGNLALPNCYLELVDQRFDLAFTSAPDCSCTRSCGLVSDDCP